MSEKIARDQKFIIDFQNVQWFNEAKASSIVSSVLSKSSIYQRLNRVLILRRESDLTVKNYLDMYDVSTNGASLEETLALLAAMNELARNSDVHFSVVVYPLLYKDTFGTYPFAPIHAFLKEVSEQYGISFVDLQPAFEPYDSLKDFIVHPLDYHPNGQANFLVADFLRQAHATTPIVH